MTPRNPKLLIVVNADWFFVSHRLRLARAARDEGFEVHVASTESEAAATIVAEGFGFHRIFIDRGGTNPVRDARTIRDLLRVYRSVRPDLVHHVTVKPVVYGGLVARVLRIPSLNAITGMGHAFIEKPDESFASQGLRAALRAAWRVSLGGEFAWSLFQNESDRSYYESHGIAPRERAFLVPGSGVDTAHFSERPLPEGTPLVLLPARLIWAKGIAEFVEAAALVRAKMPGCRFAIVGRLDADNPAAVDLATVEQWVSEGVLEWWGSVAQREMPEKYAQATLVVLPSHSEGLPLAVVEAQAVGRPVVTTDIPGCRHAVLPEETAWLVPPRSASALAAAIVEALSDRIELERRAKNARRFAVERFREEAIFGAILDAYRKVLDGV